MKSIDQNRQRCLSAGAGGRLPGVLLLLAALAAGLLATPARAGADVPENWSPIIQGTGTILASPVYLGNGQVVYDRGSDLYLLDTATDSSSLLAAGMAYAGVSYCSSTVFVASSGELYFITKDQSTLGHYANARVTSTTPADLGLPGYVFNTIDGSGPDNIYLALYKNDGSQPDVLLHYDGSAWSPVDLSGVPGYGQADLLASVCVLGTDDVYLDWLDVQAGYKEKLSYYNGSAWSGVAGYASTLLMPGKYLPTGQMLVLCSDKYLRVFQDGAQVNAISLTGVQQSNLSFLYNWIAPGGSYTYFTDQCLCRYDGSGIESVALPPAAAQGSGWELAGLAVDGQGILYLTCCDNNPTYYFYKTVLSNTPPAFTTGYPSAAGLTASGFTLQIALNEPGTAYYKVVARGVDPGSDYTDWTPVAIPGAAEVDTVLGALSPGTGYDVYVVAEDTQNHLQASPTLLPVTTLDASSDTTPPQFTSGYPQAANLTDSGFSLAVQLDESGTVYYKVEPHGAAVSTGNGQSVAEAIYQDPDGSIAVPGLSQASGAVSGLTGGTAYDVYVVAADVVGNLQAAPVELNLTTPTVPVFTQPPAAGILSSTLVDIRCQAEGDRSLSGCYYLLQEAGTAAPPAVDILSSGKEANNGSSNSQGGIYTDSFSALITGLQPGHTYDAYLVLATANPGVYGAPYKLEFTTTTGIEGYTWLDLGEAPVSTVLKNIGNNKFLVRDDLYGTKRGAIIDLGANTTTDFVYQVSDAYVMADDDFFFSEIDGSNCYVRRSVSGTVYDRMPCAITNPQSFAGDAAAVYVFGGGLAQYNPSTGAWDQITVDPGLPAATFTKGVCTLHYLYLEGNLTADNSMVLYSYDRDSGAWADITPPGLYGSMLLALGDQGLLVGSEQSAYRCLLRYRNGSWEQASDFDPSYTVGAPAGTGGLGTGLVFVCHNNYGSASLTTAQYFDGADWRELPLPGSAYLGVSACAGLDGNVYFLCATNGGDHLYELASVASGDTTPPVITTSAANTTVTSSSYTFTVQAVDAVDGLVTPTVKLGGAGGQTLTGTLQADGSYSYTASLAEGANTIYIQASDESGNQATATCAVTYTTTGATPPAFISGYPQTANLTAAGCELQIALDEPGTAYYKVVATATDPGSNYTGWTALSVPGTTEVSASVSGLAPGAAYDLYVIAEDTAGNWQAAPVKLSVTTQTQTVRVTGVSLNKHDDTLAVGGSDSLTATVAPDDATDQDLTWSSSDPGVASMVYSGGNCTVTGHVYGSATITATTNDGGFSDSCLVTVQSGVQTVRVTGVSLDKHNDTLTVGGSDSLTATVAPDDATDQSVYWRSSNSSVATVVYGLVNALAPGTATITATTADGGFSDTCLITVSANRYDLNDDGKINVQDLVLIGQHFAETGAPGWISEDINQDGKINVQDLVLVGQHFSS